ncbi:MAG: radical SAM protein [Deferrisomatales bacterium]
MPQHIQDPSGCIHCGFCTYYVSCPGRGVRCIGCGACVKGCPTGSRRARVVSSAAPTVPIRVDGRDGSAPAGASLAFGLRQIGAGDGCADGCGTGGCWACAVLVDGEPVRACCTEIRPGMDVVTQKETLEAHPPLRAVSFFPEHLHASLSVFTHGCNYGCDFCHNWDITFSSTEAPVTPQEAAERTRKLTERRGNRRTGISGGEPTLNRRWLVEYVARLRHAGPQTRIQLDTNASLLTSDYLDELWRAGVTDISPDLKGLELDTFQQITGVGDPSRARRYLDTSWRAVEEIATAYADRLHVAVAIPYHPDLVTPDEVVRMGRRLAELRRGLDVNVIVYQPAFRRREARWVPPQEVKEALRELGSLELRLWLQTGDDIPPPVAPDELTLSTEEWS